MNLLNWAYVHFVIPALHRRTYGGLAKQMRKYAQLESLPLEKNRELQWQALVQLLAHAYSTTAFYKRRFDEAGVRPEAISSPADLQKIPPLTREDIREHFEELRSSRFSSEEVTQAATGGTTDTPVPILRSRQSVLEKNALQICFNRWAGFLPGDKVFYLWGARQDFVENPGWRWRLYDRHLMRQMWAPTSLFNDAVLETYRLSLNRFKPRVVYAYPTPLALFCQYLRESGGRYHRPACVICTAEPLLDQQRRTIEDVMGRPVFEHYGSRESGMIAAECERHQGMHLNPAAAYVEFVPVAGSEVEGLHEMLVTDLLNYGMPLLRYRINDCALLGPESCACGRGYALLGRITGRTTEVFYLPNGDIVPGVALTNRVLQVCPGLKKVQIIQETRQDFRVRYVPGAGFAPAHLDLLKTNLGRFFADRLDWTFEPVQEIPRERSGKTRFCISRVEKPAAPLPMTRLETRS